ncbi:MAG: hypothetical protein ACOC1X_03735 [Promethearchaeota archaeon]
MREDKDKNLKEVNVKEVIEIKVLEGYGTEGDPITLRTYIFEKDGTPIGVIEK